MPALPSSIIDPRWHQFQALIPEHHSTPPWGCHKPSISDRIIFDKLIHVLVLGAAYEKMSDTTCSTTTIRRRRDDWITAGVFHELEQFCLKSLRSHCGARS